MSFLETYLTDAQGQLSQLQRRLEGLLARCDHPVIDIPIAFPYRFRDVSAARTFSLKYGDELDELVAQAARIWLEQSLESEDAPKLTVLHEVDVEGSSVYFSVRGRRF